MKMPGDLTLRDHVEAFAFAMIATFFCALGAVAIGGAIIWIGIKLSGAI